MAQDCQQVKPQVQPLLTSSKINSIASNLSNEQFKTAQTPLTIMMPKQKNDSYMKKVLQALKDSRGLCKAEQNGDKENSLSFNFEHKQGNEGAKGQTPIQGKPNSHTKQYEKIIAKQIKQKECKSSDLQQPDMSGIVVDEIDQMGPQYKIRNKVHDNCGPHHKNICIGDVPYIPYDLGTLKNKIKSIWSPM